MPKIAGKEIGPIGYGMMGLTKVPTPTPREAAFAAMKKALSMGANFWNAGQFYGTPEYNSLHLLEAYFEKYPEDASKVVLSVKGAFDIATASPDNSPAGIRKSVETCVKLLKGRKSIDIFEPARADPKVPIEDVMKTLIGLQQEGLFEHVGLSEVSAETVRRAATVGRIAGVEIELSLWATDPLNNGLLDICSSLDIPIIGYSPLGQGFLTGAIRHPSDLAEGDYRKSSPRFQPDAFANNLELVDKIKVIATRKGCPPSQIAMAWVMSLNKKGLTVIPLPGASSEARVAENSTIANLTEDELSSINGILKEFKVVGGRYGGKLAKLMEG